MAKRILLDTSFLMAMAQGQSSGFDEIELIFGKPEYEVTEGVLSELRSLAGIGERRTKKVKRSKLAILALNYAQNLRKVEVQETYPVDDAILKCAREMGYVVATLDNELILKLRKHNLTTITLRRGRVHLLGSPF